MYEYLLSYFYKTTGDANFTPARVAIKRDAPIVSGADVVDAESYVLGKVAPYGSTEVFINTFVLLQVTAKD